jgi:uncharacterized membrane protein YebE (DUF533 family)
MGMSHIAKTGDVRMKSNLLVAALLSVTALSAFAQPTPVIDQRQAKQEARIEQGVASGQLTSHEAAKLERGQRHVAKVKANAKADGVVTPAERAHISHAQNVQSRRIAKEKHDRQHLHS